MVLTLVNMIIRAVWWCRVGRLTTWKKIGNIVLGQTSEYEILVKPIFTGITSFGTYDIEGGWPAFILRKKENGDLWAVIGKIPKDFEEYQIDCVRV